MSTRSAAIDTSMARLLKRIQVGVEFLAVAGGYLASAALLLMTVGVSLDVAARYFLGAGTKAAIELSGYALVAIVFFGLAYTHKTNGHIEIDFVTQRLSARTKRWLSIASAIVFLGYTLFLGYFGWRTFWTSYEFGTTSRTGLDVAIWPYQLVIPVGLALVSLLLACNILVALAQPSAGAKDES